MVLHNFVTDYEKYGCEWQTALSPSPLTATLKTTSHKPPKTTTPTPSKKIQANFKATNMVAVV